MNKNISKILFKQFKKEYYGLTTVEELKSAKRDYCIVSNNFGIYKECIESFISLKEREFKNKSLNDLIKPIEEIKPLNFDLKGLSSVKDKINKLDNLKLKYEFKGLFNLLNDRTNLIYNSLYIREQIIKDLNKFKSLRFFKVGYISRYNLKNEFKNLTFKNNATVGHTKIYFIKTGLYVLKTLKPDDISLKVFYVGNKYKTLLKSSKVPKRTLKGDKFNLSSTEAYKVLDKKDNMKYYSYCNNMGLDRKNRQLLKSIRKSKKMSRESLIDLLEERREEIREDIEISSNLEVLYLEIELQEIEEKLQELKTLEEDNSMESETFLSDYF